MKILLSMLLTGLKKEFDLRALKRGNLQIEPISLSVKTKHSKKLAMKSTIFGLILILSTQLTGVVAQALPQPSLVVEQSAPSFLNRILSETLADPEFNKTYLRDGCYLRAHWIAAEINEAQKTPKKVFIHPALPNEKMKVRFETGQAFEWVFHVAAAYQNPGSEQVWVLDPAFSAKPLSLDQWTNIFQSQNSEMKLQVQLTGAEVYHLAPAAIADWAYLAEKGPFSDKAMEFIRDSMSQLFLWETFE